MLELQLICIFRAMLAGICGSVVGLERKNRSKEAGVRTHFVVACGAAIIMMVSKYAFFDVSSVGDKIGFVGEIKFDPSRVAATIASGIGFLGAGMIFVHKNNVTGLTTAAGIWTTSGIGMAIGAGLYVLGFGSTLIILIAQVLLHIDFHRSRNARMKILNIKNVVEDGFQSYLTKEFEKMNIRVHTAAVELTDDGNRNYTFTIELPNTVGEDDIITMVKYKSSIKPCP